MKTYQKAGANLNMPDENKTTPLHVISLLSWFWSWIWDLKPLVLNA